MTIYARSMTDDDRTDEQILNDTWAELPVAAWGMVTAALHQGSKTKQEYADEIADLANDGIRISGGQSTNLHLLMLLSNLAADLLEDVAQTRGIDAVVLAQALALESAEVREQRRRRRPE